MSEALKPSSFHFAFGWRALIVPLAILIAAVSIILVGPVLSVAGVIALATAAVVLRVPWLGFALLVASVPVQQLAAIPAGGMLLTATQLCFPIALLALLVAIIVQRQTIRTHIVILPFAGLLLVMLISVLHAQDAVSSAAEISRWLVAFGAFFVALQFVVGSSQRRITAFIFVLALGGMFEAAFGIFQSLLNLGPQSFQANVGFARAFGTFGKPNSYAGFLAMVLLPTFWVGMHYVSTLPKLLRDYRQVRALGMGRSALARRHLTQGALLASGLIGLSALMFSGIIASLSRGAWLGVLMAGLVTGLLYHRLTRILIILVPLVMATFFLSQSNLLPGSVQERIDPAASEFKLFDAGSIRITGENFAAVERMAHWQAGWRMFRSEPFLGIGIGNFNVRYTDFYVREIFRVSQGHAHNYYIQTLAETGLAGLTMYLTLIFSLSALALNVVHKSNDGFARMLALGALGSIIAVATHNFFEDLHVLNLGITMSAIWSLVIAAHIRSQQAMPKPPEVPTV